MISEGRRVTYNLPLSLSHSNRVRFECNKLHFIALKAHFTFIVGISIYQKRCSILGGSPDIQSFTNTIRYRTIILARATPLRYDSELLLFSPLWQSSPPVSSV
jgi:hypothetical protein